MIDFDPANVFDQWQVLDADVGLCFPWYTHPALERIKAMDFSAKRVLEWGGGVSSLWWSRRAKEVFVIEAHQDWADWIRRQAMQRGFSNIIVECRWPEPLDKYIEIPSGFVPDVVAIDGSERTDCIKQALKLPRPLTLIVDNWQQKDIYIDADIERTMMRHGNAEVFAQPGHDDWKTALWRLT